MNVKKVIKEKGYTLDLIAEELKKKGIKASNSSLSQSINGNPTLSTLQSIADVIGCQVGDFFRDEIEDLSSSFPIIKCPHCGKPIELEVKK